MDAKLHFFLFSYKELYDSETFYSVKYISAQKELTYQIWIFKNNTIRLSVCGHKLRCAEHGSLGTTWEYSHTGKCGSNAAYL